jgi:hypothetical protein
MFSARSLQRGYKEDSWNKKQELGGGQAYDRSSD